MDNNQPRKPSTDELPLPQQPGEYVPNGNNDNPLVSGFNGNY
jgi:hypothetical protein